MKKVFKAKRSRKQAAVMNTEIRYKGPRRELVYRYVGRERAYLATVVVLGIVVLLVGVIAVKRMLGL